VVELTFFFFFIAYEQLLYTFACGDVETTFFKGLYCFFPPTPNYAGQMACKLECILECLYPTKKKIKRKRENFTILRLFLLLDELHSTFLSAFRGPFAFCASPEMLLLADIFFLMASA